MNFQIAFLYQPAHVGSSCLFKKSLNEEIPMNSSQMSGNYFGTYGSNSIPQKAHSGKSCSRRIVSIKQNRPNIFLLWYYSFCSVHRLFPLRFLDSMGLKKETFTIS